MRSSLNRNVWISSPHIPLCGWCVWSEQTCFCTSTYPHNTTQHYGPYMVHVHDVFITIVPKKIMVIHRHKKDNILIILRKLECCVFSLPSVRTDLTCQPESCQTSRSFKRKTEFSNTDTLQLLRRDEDRNTIQCFTWNWLSLNIRCRLISVKQRPLTMNVNNRLFWRYRCEINQTAYLAFLTFAEHFHQHVLPPRPCDTLKSMCPLQNNIQHVGTTGTIKQCLPYSK